MSCATSIRRWAPRISPSCCRRNLVRSRGWDRAAPKVAASSTTAPTISTIRSFHSVPAIWRHWRKRRCRSGIEAARMDVVAHFSQSYAEARAKFLAAARVRQLGVASHALAGYHGIDGEALAIDVALLGKPDAKGLLVLTSATHGIEGYCGSGVQIGLLQDVGFVRATLDAGAAVLFVHAVNPYGFSHGRRVNEDNADLNRNFRDFSVPPPPNTAYAAVHPLLVPATWPPSAEN